MSDTIAVPFPVLTAREREIALMIVDGTTGPEIATALRISVRTVEVHRQRIMRKTQLRNAVELARVAIREGWTPVAWDRVTR
jgi:DNA-binding NarL/FixJ family response regulator